MLPTMEDRARTAATWRKPDGDSRGRGRHRALTAEGGKVNCAAKAKAKGRETEN